MSEISRNNFYRIIDANLNRAKEGLRVCEEVTRFILDDARLTALLKDLRHRIDKTAKGIYPFSKLISQRESAEDVGRTNSRGEFSRRGYQDIFFANIQRAKESLRVLEEFTKLADKAKSLNFKQLRYKIYEIEKESFKKISGLSDFKQAK